VDRIFAIGDIHGCFNKLCALMEKLDVDKDQDCLIFLGDYIDRGPQSLEVVDYLIGLPQDGYRTVFLKGNHEIMFENYLSGRDDFNFLTNGGLETTNRYMQNTDFQRLVIPPSHISFFQDLRLYHETDSYIFVHAGLAPGVPLDKQQEKDLLWIREPFIRSDYSFGKKVIFGHTPFKQPLITENKIGIDTGAVYGNTLTCVELPAEKFYSV
jgi:serine/threonine protein phosphatase 1